MHHYKAIGLYLQQKYTLMASSRHKYAIVLTGDVVGSSKLKAAQRRQLLTTLQAAAEVCKTFVPDFTPELFQGDSFQGYTAKAPSKALRAALYIIYQCKSRQYSIRISVGVGNISFNTGQSRSSDGTAFQQSGRQLEAMKKKDQQLFVSTDDEQLQQEWAVHAQTLNYLLKRCTAAQASALCAMLQGQTQQQAAETLQIKQPAVQQRLQAAGWDVLQNILQRFESQF